MTEPAAYYDTTQLPRLEREQATRNAKRQEDEILELFQANPGDEFSPSQVWRHFQQWPLTSIRRAMTVLTERHALEKLTEKRRGMYGKPEHVWRLARPSPVVQGRLI